MVSRACLVLVVGLTIAGSPGLTARQQPELTAILQRADSYVGVPTTALIYFWNSGGALIDAGGHAIAINARSTLVLSAGTVTGVAGNSGSVTVTHSGRYGDLVGKAR